MSLSAKSKQPKIGVEAMSQPKFQFPGRMKIHVSNHFFGFSCFENADQATASALAASSMTPVTYLRHQ